MPSNLSIKWKCLKKRWENNSSIWWTSVGGWTRRQSSCWNCSVEDGERKFIIHNPTTRVTSKLSIFTFSESSLTSIKQVFTKVKFITCRDDKLALKQLKDILKLRLQIVIVNNTEIVQDYPKRILLMFLYIVWDCHKTKESDFS